MSSDFFECENARERAGSENRLPSGENYTAILFVAESLSGQRTVGTPGFPGEETGSGGSGKGIRS